MNNFKEYCKYLLWSCDHTEKKENFIFIQNFRKISFLDFLESFENLKKIGLKEIKIISTIYEKLLYNSELMHYDMNVYLLMK